MVTNNSPIKDALHQIRTRALRDAPVYLSHVSMAEMALNEAFEKQLQLVRIEAKIEELTEQLNGYNAGLKGQSTDFVYVMRPILANIERRIKEYTTQKAHLTTKGGNNE